MENPLLRMKHRGDVQLLIFRMFTVFSKHPYSDGSVGLKHLSATTLHMFVSHTKSQDHETKQRHIVKWTNITQPKNLELSAALRAASHSMCSFVWEGFPWHSDSMHVKFVFFHTALVLECFPINKRIAPVSKPWQSQTMNAAKFIQIISGQARLVQENQWWIKIILDQFQTGPPQKKKWGEGYNLWVVQAYSDKHRQYICSLC